MAAAAAAAGPEGKESKNRVKEQGHTSPKLAHPQGSLIIVLDEASANRTCLVMQHLVFATRSPACALIRGSPAVPRSDACQEAGQRQSFSNMHEITVSGVRSGLGAPPSGRSGGRVGRTLWRR